MIDKIKLTLDECVMCSTYELACAVCQQAARLGLSRKDTLSYERATGWEAGGVCYYFHNGTIENCASVKQSDSVIPATEWLNRHDIFTRGQDVLIGKPDEVLQLGTYVGDTFVTSKRAPNVAHRCGHITSLLGEWNPDGKYILTTPEGRKITLNKREYVQFVKSSSL